MGVSEFGTCDDWMATNDLRNTSVLGGISRGIPYCYLRKWLGVSKTCQMYLFTVMKHHVHCQYMI